jgi:G3E family GTPase
VQSTAARQWVTQRAPRSTLVLAEQARVPMPLLDGSARVDDPSTPTQDATCDHRHGGDDVHHDSQFETWVLQPRQPFSAEALRELLRTMPAGVLRLKGVVATDRHGWSELQFAGRYGSLRRAVCAPVYGSALVAIGLRGRLPVQALHRALADAVAHGVHR